VRVSAECRRKPVPPTRQLVLTSDEAASATSPSGSVFGSKRHCLAHLLPAGVPRNKAWPIPARCRPDTPSSRNASCRVCARGTHPSPPGGAAGHPAGPAAAIPGRAAARGSAHGLSRRGPGAGMMGAVSTGAPRPALSSGAATACRGWHTAVRWAADYRTGECRRDCGRHGRLWQARAPAGRLREGPAVLRPASRRLRSSWPAAASLRAARGSSWRTPVRTVRRCRPER
jgi:hypothetical protein